MIILIHKFLNLCMFDWSGENGNKSGNFDILCECQPWVGQLGRDEYPAVSAQCQALKKKQAVFESSPLTG